MRLPPGGIHVRCVSSHHQLTLTRGVTALLKKMDYRDVVVAVDGSLFRHHPHFHNVMKSRVAQVTRLFNPSQPACLHLSILYPQLMGTDYKFDIILSEDGSGRGAALVAAVLGGRQSPSPSPARPSSSPARPSWPACTIL